MALSNARNILFQQTIQQILVVIAISIVMHTLYLCVHAIMVSKYILNVPLKQAISVVIMSSQKSSPVGLAVISNLAATSSHKGLFAIPCIIGQLIQIFIGTFIAPRLASLVDESANTPAYAPITPVATAAVVNTDNGIVGIDGESNVSITSSLELVNRTEYNNELLCYIKLVHVIIKLFLYCYNCHYISS